MQAKLNLIPSFKGLPKILVMTRDNNLWSVTFPDQQYFFFGLNTDNIALKMIHLQFKLHAGWHGRAKFDANRLKDG